MPRSPDYVLMPSSRLNDDPFALPVLTPDLLAVVSDGERRASTPAAPRWPTPPSETLFTYEDYVTVDGLTVPTRFRGYAFEGGRRGAFKNEAWADSISFRRTFDPSRLEAPEGAHVAPPPGG